jgi:hypothetical protein
MCRLARSSVRSLAAVEAHSTGSAVHGQYHRRHLGVVRPEVAHVVDHGDHGVAVDLDTCRHDVLERDVERRRQHQALPQPALRGLIREVEVQPEEGSGSGSTWPASTSAAVSASMGSPPSPGRNT